MDKYTSPYMIENAKSLQRVVEEMELNGSESPLSDLSLFQGKFLAGPILLSLATEVALKAWQCRERNGAPDQTHDLLNLFDGLEPGTQDLIAQGLAGQEHLLVSSRGSEEYVLPFQIGEQIPRVKILRAILRYYRNSFTDWRYLYEKRRGMTFELSALDAILTGVIDAYCKR